MPIIRLVAHKSSHTLYLLPLLYNSLGISASIRVVQQLIGSPTMMMHPSRARTASIGNLREAGIGAMSRYQADSLGPIGRRLEGQPEHCLLDESVASRIADLGLHSDTPPKEQERVFSSIISDEFQEEPKMPTGWTRIRCLETASARLNQGSMLARRDTSAHFPFTPAEPA
jgi:hypothetical protein